MRSFVARMQASYVTHGDSWGVVFWLWSFSAQRMLSWLDLTVQLTLLMMSVGRVWEIA